MSYVYMAYEESKHTYGDINLFTLNLCKTKDKAFKMIISHLKYVQSLGNKSAIRYSTIKEDDKKNWAELQTEWENGNITVTRMRVKRVSVIE